MALLYSQTVPFGSPAPDFSLPGADGKKHTLASFKDKKALVIIFMCNHCPYVQACWQRLVELDREFSPQGVQFVGINSNDPQNYPEDSYEKMKEYAEKNGQLFPYLCDDSQVVAKAYGAVCTPDIFVYDSEHKLQYHGRIDDNWKEPENVSTRELAEALEALIKGELPNRDQNPSMGCSIKWK